MEKQKLPHHELTALMVDMDASEVFKAFMNWLTDMDELQKKSWQTVIDEDAKVQDYLHQIEFEPQNKKRSVICTKFHNSRVKRREAKDTSQRLKPLADFVKEAKVRNLIKLMKTTQEALKKEEDFVNSERVYKPRVQEGGDE